jgi:hypothetical protein
VKALLVLVSLTAGIWAAAEARSMLLDAAEVVRAY